MAKTPNSPDATRRNIRASQARDQTLRLAVTAIRSRVRVCEARIDELDRLLSNFDRMKKRKRR